MTIEQIIIYTVSSKFLTVVIVPFFSKQKLFVGNGDLETDLVSHITTKDSNGNPTTIVTTVTLTEEPDYISVFVCDGHTITVVVSHVTTTNDIGQTVTSTVTVISYDQVGNGV